MSVVAENRPQSVIIDERQVQFVTIGYAGEGEAVPGQLIFESELPAILTQTAKNKFPLIKDTLRIKEIVIPEEWDGRTMLAFLAHVHIAAMDIWAGLEPDQMPKEISLIVPDKFRQDVLPQSIIFRYETANTKYEGVFNISEPANPAIGFAMRGTRDEQSGHSHIITDLTSNDLLNGTELTDLGKTAVGYASDIFFSPVGAI